MTDIGWAVQQLKAGLMVRRAVWPKPSRIVSAPELGGAIVWRTSTGHKDFGPDFGDHTNLFADDWELAP